MFRIEIYDSLSIDLDEKVRRLRKQAHLSNKPPLSEQQETIHNDKYCSRHDRFRQLLAFEKTEIIGGIILYQRAIMFNNKHILLGGIGGVWTQKEKRRQGIARALLTKSMQILKKEGCDIAYLCTDIKRLGKLYEEHGFRHLGTGHTYLGASGKRYIDHDGMIAPVCANDVFKKVLKVNTLLDLGRGNW